MTESSDPQLQLKKRARRRLVGAVAFAGLAAVVLPMVMDEEPKQRLQDVQIRIPGQEQVPVRPAEPARAALPTPSGASLASTEQAAVGASNDAAEKLQAVVPTAKLSGAAPPDKVADKAPEKKVAKPPEKLAEQSPEKKTVKPVDKTPDKQPVAKKIDKLAEKPEVKKAEKPTPKLVEKPVEKPVEKAAEKPVTKAVEKPVARPLDKAVDDAGKPVADKPGEKPVDEGAKPAADEPARPAAATSPAGKAAAAAPAKTGGQHVILIGAFANPENVKQLQGKMGGLGVSTYTEMLNSPDGAKTRVRAGPFPTREAADKALEKLKRSGINGVVAGRQ
ncbi:MAG: SPOR domain-containing protein [Candidatus Accumulibacter phosphatis]|uniref:SPOR domain-containing protein n=1 Tax=Candidatus Accumulibacter phosphatis TaxID=327160 RepID=UPI001A410E6B|nr:SPOR domain-containing protein [Candidatus Accumulibacter phosphatis]